MGQSQSPDYWTHYMLFLDYGRARRDLTLEQRNVLVEIAERSRGMKGFYVGEGYMGCVNGQYMLFADEADYMDYVEEQA